MLNNMKIGKRLATVFIVILVLFLISSVVSLTNMMSVADALTQFYKGPYEAVETAMEMRRSIQSAEKNIVLSTTAPDSVSSKAYTDQAETDLDSMKMGIEKLRESYNDKQGLLDQFYNMMNATADTRKQIIELSNANRNTEALKLYNDKYAGAIADARNTLAEIGNDAKLVAEEFYNDGILTRNTAVIMMVVISSVIIIITILLCIYATRSITKPVKRCVERLESLANGDLTAPPPDVHTKDEMGNLANVTASLITSLSDVVRDISHILGEIAGGNLDVSSTRTYTGDFIPIQTATVRIVSSLNTTLSQINEAADQVSSGAGQVSSGAQALSQGATEQASSVEELAATINEMTSQISKNAENANKASSVSEAASGEVMRGNQQMQEMIGAMEDISRSSSEIAKIIKTIEDIAFQTNILALNAAVEAARAGAAGKGFAVVADEVRNLASKSAEAAKNTTTLIENSIKAVENGTRIASDTAQSLQAIVVGAKQSTDLVDEIAEASKLQASSAVQISQGVDQISSVVQTNSATAEESAAASEELSGQAQMLKELVGRFRLQENTISTSSSGMLTYTQVPDEGPSGYGDGSSKY